MISSINTKVYHHAEGVQGGEGGHAEGDRAVRAKRITATARVPATWLLQQIIDQQLGNTLIGTNCRRGCDHTLRKKGVKVGDPFDMEIGRSY